MEVEMEEERMEVFLEMFREEPPVYIRELEKRARENGVPVIRRGTRDVLRYLLRTKKPKHILEVGTAVAYSALYMKEYMPQDAAITTIEKVQMRLTEARKNLSEYDKEGKICLIEGDASDVLHQLTEKKRRFDFIFLDAAKGQYLSFLPDIMKLLVENGTLISDNILHEGDVLQSRYAVTRRDRTIHARMREYLEVLVHHEELETICLPVGDGITISTKR